MELYQAQAIVAAFSYKPGCKLEIEPPRAFEYSGITLRFTLRVDCLEPGITYNNEIATERHIDGFTLDVMDEGAFKHIIQTMIEYMELHEMDEWLKFNGEHLRNPHPERISNGYA